MTTSGTSPYCLIGAKGDDTTHQSWLIGRRKELQGRDFFLWRRSNAHQSNIQIEMELDEAAEEKREELMLDLVDQRLAELAEGARNPKV